MTAAINTIDDLIEVLRANGLTLADVAPSLGVSAQALSDRLNGDKLSGLDALALLRAAEGITKDRLAALRRAIEVTGSE